jgi:hemoglobin-like flavoprotein
MQLSAHQVQSIRDTWKYFRNIDALILGDAFYTKLFTDYPFLKNAFRGDMSVHYRNLHEMLNLVVGRIDSNEGINTAITAVANQKKHYEINDSHFGCFEETLIWTLGKGMGPEWTPSAEYAWRRYFKLLTGNTMKTAATVK